MNHNQHRLQVAWNRLKTTGGVHAAQVIAPSAPFPTTAHLPRPPSPTPFLHIMIPLNHPVEVWHRNEGRDESAQVAPAEAICWLPGAWCCTNRDLQLERLRVTVQPDGLLVGRTRPAHPPDFRLLRPGSLLVIAQLQSHLCAPASTRWGPDDSRLHALNCLLLLTVEALAQQRPTHSASDHLRTALSYIQDHCDQDIGRDQVASAVGISSTHLSRILSAARGHGVQEEILRQRMHLAAHLLDSTDLPIKQVASSVSIADPSQFVRSFRRAHGCTPGHWRKRARRS